MSFRNGSNNQHWRQQRPTNAVSAVADCAPHPQTRGALVRPLRMASKQSLDSGFASGLLSPSEALSPPVLEGKLRYPKEAAARHQQLGAGAELSAEFSGLRVEELGAQERAVLDARYLKVLNEAFHGDDDGDTHLHLAVIYNFQRIAQCLVRLVPHQDFLNLRNSYLQTPLHLAALTGQAALCRHLVAAGANTTLRDRHGNTPLHLACERADLTCVRALTEPVSVQESRQAATNYTCPPPALPPVDDWNYQGLSCLHLATLSGHIELVAHLISYGATPSAGEGKSGRSPVHLAAEAGNISLLRFLVEACGAEVDAVTYGGLTGYQLALLNARLDVAESLVMLGAVRLELPDTDLEMSDSDDAEMFLKPEDFFSDVRIGGQPLRSSP